MTGEKSKLYCLVWVDQRIKKKKANCRETLMAPFLIYVMENHQYSSVWGNDRGSLIRLTDANDMIQAKYENTT